MTLKQPRSPRAHAQILQEAQEYLKAGTADRTGARAKRAELNVKRRIPVFTAGMDSVLHPGGLSRTKRSSWRYLIRSGRGPTHAVDIADLSGKNEPAVLRQLRTGESGNLLEKYIRACEKHRKLKRLTYQQRFLRVPALHFSALWLRTGTRKHDVFVPIRSMYKQLRVGRHYSMEDVEIVLRAGAERVLQFKF